jgi:pilus assembly protein CpaB
VSFAPPTAINQPLPQTEKVIVVSRDLLVGEVIDSEKLRSVDMPVASIPRNAFRDMEPVIGRMVKVPLVTGEMLLGHHLADPTNISHDIGFVIGENKVLMAFPANDLMSSLDIIQRGDIVDILVTIEQEIEPIDSLEPDVERLQSPDTPDEEEGTKKRKFTFDAMQAVGISAVIADIEYDEGLYANIPLGSEDELSSLETPQPSKVEVKAFLLALNPQDALTLKHLIDIGGVFDIVLRSPNSDQLFKLQPVMNEYLLDRYQLEVPK